MTNNLRMVFFDCDGTLVDSEVPAMGVAIDILADAVEAVFPDVTVDRPRFVQEYAGWHFDEMVSSFEKLYGVVFSDRKALSEEKTRRTLEALKSVEPVENMHTCLADLASEYGLALVTSSEFDRVNLCVTQADMDGYFPQQHKYSAHNSLPKPKHKPAPDVYLLAKEMEGAQDDVVAIEDSKSGVLSARAAGIPVIGLVAGKHIPDKEKAAAAQRLLDHGAAVVVRDARDIPAAVRMVLDKDPAPAHWHGTVWHPEDPVLQDAPAIASITPVTQQPN
jgi:beta-phosphoglucomutase-like phosphatase (HAD superfamily)